MGYSNVDMNKYVKKQSKGLIWYCMHANVPPYQIQFV